MESLDYQVVIIGASVGGCTAARLYADAGLRVALVEQTVGEQHYKHVCTHFLQPCAMEVLRRLGLVEALEQVGARPNAVEMWARWGWIRDDPDAPPSYGYNIRRETLDPLLRKMVASNPLVDLHRGYTVDGLLRDASGRICGVSATRAGERREFRGALVAAADGEASPTARLAGVPAREFPNERFTFYGYYADLPLSSPELNAQYWYMGQELAYAFRNDGGLTLLGLFLPRDRLAWFREDPEGNFRRLWERIPGRPDIGDRPLVGRLRGATKLVNRLRPAASPGLALLGDAALTLDPIWGTGCGFAMLSAQWLVDHTTPVLAQRNWTPRAVDRALAAYGRRHRAETRGHRMHIVSLSTGRAFNAVERVLIATATADPRVGRRVVAYLGRVRGLLSLASPGMWFDVARARLRSLFAARARPELPPPVDLASEDPSLWSDVLVAPRPGPRAEGSPADVAIIGGGLAGLSAALHILRRRPGAHVVVLEASQVGNGASSRSTGMLTPGVGQDLPGQIRRFGAERARTMYLRSLEAVRYVAELVDQEGIDAELQMTGQMVLARGTAGRARLRRLAEAMGSLDLPHEALSTGALLERLRLSGLSEGPDSAGPAAIRMETAGVLHPGRLLMGLADAVRRKGGEIREGSAVRELARADGGGVILADGRPLRARQIVVANSGYATAMGLYGGMVWPLHLRVVLTEPLEAEVLRQIGWGGREAVIDSRRLFSYFRLTQDNRILLGGGLPRYHQDSRWDADRKDEVANLEAELRALFPAEATRRIARSWTGVIGYTFDNIPVVGRLPGRDDAWFAGAWCGHGIALSLSAGRWLAAQLDGEPAEADLPWFRSRAPHVPIESLHPYAFRVGAQVMQLADHLA